MSERKTIELEDDILADWWIVAATLASILSYGESLNPWLPPESVQPSWSWGANEVGPQFALYTKNHKPMADIQITRGPSPTHVHIKTAHGNVLTCRRMLDTLHQMAHNISHIRRTYEPTAENAIETYYRRRALGSKVTLSKIAEEFGYTEAYLKKAKREYDAAGKWGSKKKP